CFFSRRRRHTRSKRDWSSDVCSSDLNLAAALGSQIAAAGECVNVRLLAAAVPYFPTENLLFQHLGWQRACWFENLWHRQGARPSARLLHWLQHLKSPPRIKSRAGYPRLQHPGKAGCVAVPRHQYQCQDLLWGAVTYRLSAVLLNLHWARHSACDSRW